MTVPYDPDQPGSAPPPPPAPGPWTPPAYPGAPLPGAPTPPLQGYAVPGSWTAPAWRPTRPGTVTAAVVITYIQVGLSLVLVLGLLALRSVSEVADILGSYIEVTAALTFILGVLYVVAAVQLQRGRNRGFLLGLTIATVAINVFEMFASVAAAASGTRFGGSTVCSLILPVTVLILLLQPATREWIDANRTVPH